MTETPDVNLAIKLGRSRSIKRNSSSVKLKHLDGIIKADAEDDSLTKYKQTLLAVSNFDELNINENETATLQIESLEIICEKDDIQKEFKFGELENSIIIIKEGSEFNICLNCTVSGDILNGLRYSHILKKLGIKCHEISEMVGSYAPKNEVQKLVIRHVEAPKGVLGRGEYKVASALTDDGEKEHFSWNWVLKIAKEW